MASPLLVSSPATPDLRASIRAILAPSWRAQAIVAACHGDGPQEKSKNTIGGFYVIRAKDLQEAIHVASRIPGARFGSVEVRLIHQYPAKD